MSRWKTAALSSLALYEADRFSGYSLFNEVRNSTVSWDASIIRNRQTCRFFDESVNRSSFEFVLTAQCFLIATGLDNVLPQAIQAFGTSQSTERIVRDERGRKISDINFAFIFCVLIGVDLGHQYECELLSAF